jgi:hypothetical protein
MRMDSSAVMRGREISCVERDTFVVHPRAMTLEAYVSFDGLLSAICYSP